LYHYPIPRQANALSQHGKASVFLISIFVNYPIRGAPGGPPGKRCIFTSSRAFRSGV